MASTEVNCLNQWQGDNWKLYNGDCCDLIRGLPDNSIDFGIHSPPFCSLYVYSDSECDMGNCGTHDEFLDHYAYLIPELLRVTVPGRLHAVHCMDIPLSKQNFGVIGLYDFPGEIKRLFRDAGWQYHSKVTIWKDPVVAMQRTKSIGLLHKQLSKDSSVSRQGIADELLIFRKWDGIADGSCSTKPVHDSQLHPEARFNSYVGSMPPGCQLAFSFESDEDGFSCEVVRQNGAVKDKRRFSIDVWQRYASPIWFDIDQSNVLSYRGARTEQDEAHICPLQLDVIERSIHLWTNPGDVVLSPFAGIGSEGVGALRHGRKFVGLELKYSYCDQATKNLTKAEKDFKQKDRPLLFEAIGESYENSSRELEDESEDEQVESFF